MKKLWSFAAGLLLCAFLVACEGGLPVEPQEKTLALRAADLVRFGYGLERLERYETFSKTRYFDGSKEIVYEFRTPDNETEHPLYLNATMTFERKSSDAVLSRTVETAALTGSLRVAGIKSREIENFYDYGDSSDFYVLEKDGKPIGNIFSMLHGKKVYLIVMTGFYFDDAATWKDLVEEKLKSFSAYEPA